MTLDDAVMLGVLVLVIGIVALYIAVIGQRSK